MPNGYKPLYHDQSFPVWFGALTAPASWPRTLPFPGYSDLEWSSRLYARIGMKMRQDPCGLIVPSTTLQASGG